MRTKRMDTGLLILRLSLGILMLLHGVAKLFHGIDGIEQMIVARGLPSFVAYGVYVGEVIAPLFLIAGYATRVAALVFAFNCLTAALLAHGSDFFSIASHGGWALELLGLYFFGALALVFTGGGKFALSRKRRWD